MVNIKNKKSDGVQEPLLDKTDKDDLSAKFGLFGKCKIVAAVVSVACMSYDLYTNLEHEKDASDPQKFGMIVGYAVAAIGAGGDTLMSIYAGESAASRNRETACIAGTAFNLGGALQTAFQPGCWTQADPGLRYRVGCGMGGTVAVIATHYCFESPAGPWIVGFSLAGDCLLTLNNTVYAVVNIAKRIA